MKTFAGIKPLDVIKRQCREAGLNFNDELHRKRGWDTVRIDCPSDAYVIYNTFNGRFFGMTDRGIHFDSSLTRYEKKAWFLALLSFFYVEKT